MTIGIGLVGTGYAAKARVKALMSDVRSQPMVVFGYQETNPFAEQHGLQPARSLSEVVMHSKVDLVVVANASAFHGETVEAALKAGKHVVVEYPLSLDVIQAQQLVELAEEKGLLLHVEHIELLGGLHVTMREVLPQLGEPGYVNYRTLNPALPAPMKWTYCLALFGFPFCGALSRVHRLTNLFGRVTRASCCTRLVPREDETAYFKSILCSGRLVFESGLVAELSYGKGEQFWLPHRYMEVQGTLGAMSFVGNEGLLVAEHGQQTIAVPPRKGLFIKDTGMVLDYLTEGVPLYVSPQDSVYALTVGDALRRSSETGKTVYLD